MSKKILLLFLLSFVLVVQAIELEVPKWKTDPVSAGDYKKRGDEYLINNKFKLALVEYNKAIKLDPFYGSIYMGRAQLGV